MAVFSVVKTSVLGLLLVLSYLSLFASASAIPPADNVKHLESRGGPPGGGSRPWGGPPGGWGGPGGWGRGGGRGGRGRPWGRPGGKGGAAPPKTITVTPFQLQAFNNNQRYQGNRPNFISFGNNNDGTLTNNWQEAAQFWIYEQQLRVGNQFVHLDFSNGYAVFKLENRPSTSPWQYTHGADGWLHIQAPGLNFGFNSEGVFCQSEDGGLFVQGQNKPPFGCRDVGLAPKQNPGPKPRSPPPRWNPHPERPQPRPTPPKPWTPPPPTQTATPTEPSPTGPQPTGPSPTGPSEPDRSPPHNWPPHRPTPPPSEPTNNPPPTPTPSPTRSWPTQRPSTTSPAAPDPSSDMDWPDWVPDWVEKRSSNEFDAEGEVVE